MKKIIIFLCLLSCSSLMADGDEKKYEARALVSATEQVLITSEIAARVKSINFFNGEAFVKGEVLISFDCELYEAQRNVKFC